MAATTPSDEEVQNESYRQLTAFQRDLLVVISQLETRSEDAPYGLGIKHEIEDYYGTNVNHGRLYPNLDTLVEEGLVEKGKHDERTNSYQLTVAGKSALMNRKETVHLAGSFRTCDHCSSFLPQDESLDCCPACELPL